MKNIYKIKWNAKHFLKNLSNLLDSYSNVIKRYQMLLYRTGQCAMCVLGQCVIEQGQVVSRCHWCLMVHMNADFRNSSLLQVLVRCASSHRTNSLVFHDMKWSDNEWSKAQEKEQAATNLHYFVE